MAYHLPDFNAVIGYINAWATPNTPPTAGTNDFTFTGQIYYPSRYALNTFAKPQLLLRCPKDTSIRSNQQSFSSSSQPLIEAPHSSGLWFIVNWVFQMHWGFSNEYRLLQCGDKAGASSSPNWDLTPPYPHG